MLWRLDWTTNEKRGLEPAFRCNANFVRVNLRPLGGSAVVVSYQPYRQVAVRLSTNNGNSQCRMNL